MITSTLSALNLGQVGVQPSLFFLKTTATNDQIQVPGFITPSMISAANVSINNKDFLLAAASDGAEYYVVSRSGTGVITLIPAGGSAGGVPYIQTYWMGSNGKDSNSGTSIDAPKLTPEAIAALLVAGVPTVINIVDAGTYGFSSTFIVKCPLLINAPGTTFQWTGPAAGNMFFLNASSPLIINGGNIVCGSNLTQVFRGFSSIVCSCVSFLNATATRIWEDAFTNPGDGVPQAVFNITSSGSGAFVFKANGDQIINAADLGVSSINSTLTSGDGAVIVNASTFGGTLGGTADYKIDIANIIDGYSATTTGNVGGLYGPTFGGVSAFPQALAGNNFGSGYFNNQVKDVIIAPEDATFYIDQTMSGKMIITTANTTIIGLPNIAAYPDFPESGFFVDVVQSFTPSGCQVSWSSGGGGDIVIRQASANPFYTGAGVMRVYLTVKGTGGVSGNGNTWTVTGDVFNTN